MIPYNIKGKNCIITGANSGIGKEISIELGKRGANLLLICRDLDKGLIAQKEIVKESRNHNVELFVFDLSIIESIKDGISTIKQKYNHIDILINNAGVLLFKKEMTCEGYEKTLATNYYGPYMITNQLLKTNNPQKACKIINVVSEGVSEDSFDLQMLENKKKYNGIKAYSFSKQALIYFTYETAKRMKDSNTTANCFYPGLVQTNLGKPEKGFFRITYNIMSHLLKSKFTSIEESIKPCLFLLCSKKGIKMNGYYLKRENDKVKVIKSFDEDISEELWNKTLTIIN